MNDRTSLADKLRTDIGTYGRVSRRARLCRLGIAAALAAAVNLATSVPAPAQSQQTPGAPGAQPSPPKAAAPRRRGITAPESSAPSPSGDKSSKGDDDIVPGGLPGARPKTPVPGGGPSNPGG
jgi:hypothetical protein